MVDSNPPVIRATILVLIACGALWLYRRKLGYNSLAAAGLVVLAINPSDLFNVGAQLSFLSVAVLIYFGSRWGEGDERDALERLAEKNLSFFSTKWRHWKAFFKELTLFGIAIWLVTTPLVMARFHLFSPVALVMNILLWIPMTLGLLSGFAILAAGAVCPPLAHLCGNFCNANLWLLDKSVRFADAAPGTHYWVAGPNDWWLAVFYAGLAVAACFPQVRPSRRWCAALALLWISVGIAASFAGKSHHSLQCTFVSVEHGAAAILELPSGQTVLCDAGQMASPYRGAQSIAAVLWSRGITHLDAVVLSHADIDHFDALPELLEKFSVGAVYVSPSMFENPSATLRSLKEAIEKKKIPCREIYKGCLLEGGQNCRIETLHPARQRTQYDHNAESVVLAVEYRGFRLLLPGDIEAEGMNALLAQPSQPCTVLLAPHHGSPRNNTPEFAAWCRPRWVVLSGDGQWNTPEIQAIYRAVNGKILDTHSDGAITFHFDASGVRVETFLKNQ
jgi:competence protein ComEC